MFIFYIPTCMVDGKQCMMDSLIIDILIIIIMVINIEVIAPIAMLQVIMANYYLFK